MSMILLCYKRNATPQDSLDRYTDQYLDRQTTNHDTMKSGIEKDCEPIKNRNSCVVFDSEWKEPGTTDHMEEQKRNGPQPKEG